MEEKLEDHKDRVLRKCDELRAQDEYNESKDLLRACKDCDTELAAQEYKLINASIMLVGMACARVVGMIT